MRKRTPQVERSTRKTGFALQPLRNNKASIDQPTCSDTNICNSDVNNPVKVAVRVLQRISYSVCLAAAFLSCCKAAEDSPAIKDNKTNAFLTQAAEAESRGDYAAAQSCYKKATRHNPDSAEAWAAYGEHLRFYAHDVKAARDAFNKALAASEKNPRASAYAWRGLGELASKENQVEKAIELFKKSLNALPLADTHRSLCHLYCRQQNFKAAAEHAGEAVKLDPDDPIAILLYAAQLHRAGNQDEGLKQFEKALSLSGLDANGESAGPVHCCIYYNAAGYLAVKEDATGALKMLEKFFKTPNHRHLTREEIETDADFRSIKTTPAFNKLLKTHLAD